MSRSPPAQSISASLAAAGASESRSQICSGSSPGTKVTLSRRAKYIPAGSMAFTASLTVQKYRSRIHRASWIPFSSRTGASSRQDSTGFSVGVFSSCRSRESTMPSDPRFPLPKGTAIPHPGQYLSLQLRRDQIVIGLVDGVDRFGYRHLGHHSPDTDPLLFRTRQSKRGKPPSACSSPPAYDSDTSS